VEGDLLGLMMIASVQSKGCDVHGYQSTSFNAEYERDPLVAIEPSNNTARHLYDISVDLALT
jgi:hypothetical protein